MANNSSLAAASNNSSGGELSAYDAMRVKISPWYIGISRKGRLRTKFLLSLVLVSMFLTCSTLLVVQRRIKAHVREQIREELQNSLVTFQHFQRLRDESLKRSAALLANLPILEALMTCDDHATIEDGSAGLWEGVGSELFVLADRRGRLMALHTLARGFTDRDANESLQRSLHSGDQLDWWYGGGHLFQVVMQPIYFGDPANHTQLGVLVLGSEINAQVAEDVRRVASSQVAFWRGTSLIVSTLSPTQNEILKRQAPFRFSGVGTPPVDIDLGEERFVATAKDIPPRGTPDVSLTVLKSYNKATIFLSSLNRELVGLGLVAVMAGGALMFLIARTFTRPLAALVGGEHALEKGDVKYPLEAHGEDEVSELTRSFDRMRRTLMRAQQELLQAERLATIGRMASTISHDLRHSLTAIVAYAEYLSEGGLAESLRVEFYQEIRLAVNQMTDQLQTLLEFSRPVVTSRPVKANLSVVIERAVRALKMRPEFSRVSVRTSVEGGSEGWFDPAKLERVFYNLLLNACEASLPNGGVVEVGTSRSPDRLEIRVADRGSGIPEDIQDQLFQPFVTSGKENGIGLGLAVVQKIVQEHSGHVEVEHTGPGGSVICVSLPAGAPDTKRLVQDSL
jgi:signal transduction histidine kinase